MFLKKLFSIFLISTNICLADNAVFLEKGRQSPFDGYLFTPEKTNQMYKDLMDYDTLKSVNESLNKSIVLYKQNEELYQNKVNLLLDQNNKLSVNLFTERQDSNWERIVWFSLGVIGTGLAAYGIKKASQ